MSDNIHLSAEARVTSGGNKALRRTGKVPGVIYGHNIAASSVQLAERELALVLRKTGRNTLIALQVGDAKNAPKMVLTREIQRDPVTRALLHIDFYEVSMTERIRAQVRVIVTGEAVSPDLKSGAGVLLQELSSFEIECLPGDLIDSITIDVSALSIGDVVRVKDLVVPAAVTVLEKPDDEVLRIQRFVEAKAEEVAVVEPTEVEVIEKGKKDEEVEAEKKK